MTKWDVIDAADDEETKQVVNDGSLTSLYEVVKLAYLEPTDELFQATVPKIGSSLSFGFACISIGPSVFIFGESGSSLNLNLSLKATIDVMVWLPNGKFLLLADNSGSLHCLHIESQQIMFTKKLPMLKPKTSLFIEGKSFTLADGSTCVVLITTNGKIIRLEGIETDSLEEGWTAKDIPYLSSLQSKIALSVIPALNEDTQVLCSDCVMYGSSNLCIWMATEDGIYSWISEWIHTAKPISVQLSSISCITKLIQLINGRYLAVLDQSNCFRVICGYTGIVVWDGGRDPRLKGRVLDVQKMFSDSSTVQLLLVLQSDHPDGDCSFSMFNIPSLECSHMVSVNRRASPFKLDGEAESVTYYEPEWSCEGDEALLVRLKLKSVVDGLPETRLAKLLQKHKFNEAEEFCGNFGLDVNEALKAKAKFLCDLMNPWNSPSHNSTIYDFVGSSGHFDELLVTLGRIDDNEFVTTLAINAPLSDVVATWQLLSFAKDRLAKSSQSGDSDHLSSLMQKVSKNLYCLCTFRSIFPSDDIHQWLSFSRASMFDEFLTFLQKGDLEVAATIWHRHQFEFLQRVDEDGVSHILQSVPFHIPSERLCSWLPKHLFKDLIKLCPASIEIIARWTDERIKSLEITEKEHWPSNGLKLATTTISAIETVTADFYIGGDVEVQLAVHMAQCKAHSPSSHLCRLRTTALALTDLQVLAEEFFIKLEFSKYTQEDKYAVAAALLDWLISGEEVKPLVTGFIGAFLLRHDLQLDDVLEQYVLEALASSDSDWWLYEEAPWEDKVYAVIRLISDAEVKAKCIAACVRMASVPWSEGTREMCALATALNTHYTNDLIEQERLSKLKIILRRYNLHLISYENSRNGQFILRSIVTQEGKQVMEDALMVVSAFGVRAVDAYFFRIVHLLKTECYGEIKELLLGLGVDERASVCQRLIHFVASQLSVDPFNQKSKDCLKGVTSGILAIETILEESLSLRFTRLQPILAQIRRINTLQVRYDLFPCLEDLESEECCLDLLLNFIMDLFVPIITPPPSKTAPPNLGRTTLSGGVSIGYQSGVKNASLSVAGGRDSRTIINVTGTTMALEEEKGEHHLAQYMAKVEHLATLLSIGRPRLLTLLASLAHKNGLTDIALQTTRELTNGVQSTAVTEHIFKLVELTIVQCDDTGKAVAAGFSKADPSQLMADFMRYINNMVSSAILTCNPSDIAMLNDFGLWYHIGKYLFEQCHCKGVYANDRLHLNDNSNWNFNPLLCDSSMPIEGAIVSRTIASIMKYLLHFHLVSAGKDSDTPEPGMDPADTRNEDTVDSMANLWHHLQERSQELLAFVFSQSAISTVRSRRESSYPQMTVEHELLKGLNPDRVMTLLMKTVNSKQRELPFACSLLHHLTVKESLKVLTDIIKRLGYDFPRLLMVGEIGIDYCTANRLANIKYQFSALVTKASWGKRLEQMGISFKAGFSGDQKALHTVLLELVAHSSCSFTLLNEFCDDFSWNTIEALSAYLRAAVREWKLPEVGDEYPKDESCASSEVPPSVVRKMKTIIKKMEEEKAMCVLTEEFNDTNSYNYEMLETLLSLRNSLEEESDLVDESNRGLNILRFLKVYRRQSEPGEYEIEAWLATDPKSRSLPPISKYRLPFHALYTTEKAKSKIVERELYRNTVQNWVCIAHDLKMNTDQMYFLTTQNTVSRALKKQPKMSPQQEWQVSSINGNLLAQIQTIIAKIKHPKLSTACANFVVSNLPPGKDKVDAAYRCLQLAKQILRDSDQDTADHDLNLEMICAKFETRYHRLAIEDTLHKYSLAQPHYLSMVKDPYALAFSLYEHPSLSSLATLNTGHVIDINGCVTQICKIMNFNQVSIQFELLSKWLPVTACSADDVEETISNFMLKLDQDAPDDNGNNSVDNSLSRIIFLLRCCPMDQALSYLLKQALSTDDTVGTGVRLKALRCLFAIADQETIQSYTDLTMNQIRLLLQSLTYVHRLENLGHAITPTRFNQMDKGALVEGIWRAQRHNPEALLLLVDICHDFKIPTASLWEALLAQLTNFTEVGKVEVGMLEKVLMRIRNIPHLWLLPQVTAAWTLVIYSPFKKANAPVSEENMKNCVHAVNLLFQSCPVDIPLKPLLRLCHSLNLPILALTLATKMQTKDSEVESILRKHTKSKLTLQYEMVKDVISFSKNIEDLLSNLE